MLINATVISNHFVGYLEKLNKNVTTIIISLPPVERD